MVIYIYTAKLILSNDKNDCTNQLEDSLNVDI